MFLSQSSNNRNFVLDIWRQLALQYDLTLPLEKCFMETIYQFLVQQQFLEFFILPEPRGPEATYERMFYDVSTLESITVKCYSLVYDINNFMLLNNLLAKVSSPCIQTCAN